MINVFILQQRLITRRRNNCLKIMLISRKFSQFEHFILSVRIDCYRRINVSPPNTLTIARYFIIV